MTAKVGKEAVATGCLVPVISQLHQSAHGEDTNTCEEVLDSLFVCLFTKISYRKTYFQVYVRLKC